MLECWSHRQGGSDLSAKKVEPSVWFDSLDRDLEGSGCCGLL